MKTIKITIATCVVALSTVLIWTSCQKESINENLQEHITTKANENALRSVIIGVMNGGNPELTINLNDMEQAVVTAFNLKSADEILLTTVEGRYPILIVKGESKNGKEYITGGIPLEIEDGKDIALSRGGCSHSCAGRNCRSCSLLVQGSDPCKGLCSCVIPGDGQGDSTCDHSLSQTPGFAQNPNPRDIIVAALTKKSK